MAKTCSSSRGKNMKEKTSQKPKHEFSVAIVAFGIFVFLIFASVALVLNVMNKQIEFNADCSVNGVSIYFANTTFYEWKSDKAYPDSRYMYSLNNSAIHCTIYGKGSQLMLTGMR